MSALMIYEVKVGRQFPFNILTGDIVEVSSAQMLQKHWEDVFEGPVSFTRKPQVVVVTMAHVLLMAFDDVVEWCLDMVQDQSRDASNALCHLDKVGKTTMRELR